MSKIENDHQLEISRDWAKRFRGVLEKYKTLPDTAIPPDIRETCTHSTQFLIEKIEREIEGYLIPKAVETATEQTQIKSAKETGLQRKSP